MAIAYPTSLDALNNPASTDNLDTTGVLHDQQHADANDAIEALEAKLGIDTSTVATSIDFLIKRSHAPKATVTYAATQNIDLDDKAWQLITLTGNITIGTSSGTRSATLVKTVNVILDPGASNRTVSFATGVVLLNYSNPPAAITLLANKKAVVTITSTGTNETDTIAGYSASS